MALASDRLTGTVYDMAGHAFEGAEIAGLVLGVEHARDEEERPRLLLFLLDQRLGHHQPGAGIAAAVEPYLMPWVPIPSSLPFCSRCMRPGQ